VCFPRVVGERAPQHRNRVDEAVVRHDNVGPYGVDELVLSDQPIAVVYEIDERVESSRRERHGSGAVAP